MGTRVPGYPHLKLMGTQVSLPGPGYIITMYDPLLYFLNHFILVITQSEPLMAWCCQKKYNPLPISMCLPRKCMVRLEMFLSI